MAWLKAAAMPVMGISRGISFQTGFREQFTKMANEGFNGERSEVLLRDGHVLAEVVDVVVKLRRLSLSTDFIRDGRQESTWGIATGVALDVIKKAQS